ncbi:Transferase [Penicillium canescens]|uniref:Transferase n=1 Tax=Penicillium canescens TaxID=5083 RepID=A0AAD6IIX3_PENCN|nr:Transferase [Penicillium canescens]KAJ6050222.1 Transferase [Penicillium canescens]KAJ6050914.1 Transferase [Penicillium canescens]KAJ6061418.1 Transferase [Penicillium canescens]
MTALLTFEPYVLTPLVHNVPGIHMSFFLTFYIDEPSLAIPPLEAGVNRLIELLPFLAGNVTPSIQLKGKENVYEVQPPTAKFLQEHSMLRIKYHEHYVSPKSPGAFSFSNESSIDERFIPMPFEMALAELIPVLRLQANVMHDSIVLCISFHHMAIDGYGALNLSR